MWKRENEVDGVGVMKWAEWSNFQTAVNADLT